MPVAVSRQTSNYSSSSSSSMFSLRVGMESVGSRISIGSLKRAPSIHGGAGGFGTCISQSSYSSSLGDTAVIKDERLTMQNLNDRLSVYLEKVRSLERDNRKLELQINEFYEKKTSPASKDYSDHFSTISDLRAQISRKITENQKILLDIDNFQLAAADFRIKYEVELNARMVVEADVARLRMARDSQTLAISDLEFQIESLKEELAFMKRSHGEEMHELKLQQTGAVNVEMDSVESVDLTRVLEEMREKYETLVKKNKLELEKWFQSKVETLQTKIVTHTTEVKTSHKTLSELKNTYKSLEINLQSAFSQIQRLEQSMEEINCQYGVKVGQLQVTINTLETELQQLRISIEQQQTEYNQLLDIKMRLELEIAEYRRLLEGEYEEKKTVVISQTVKEVQEVQEVQVVQEEPEDNKPHIERRVKVIVEEIVDGVVVSSSVDTKVEEIQ